jgi:hypothetical protein
MLLMMWLLHASKVFFRPLNPSWTQPSDASRAWATTTPTSFEVKIGYRPTTSPFDGLNELNVFAMSLSLALYR